MSSSFCFSIKIQNISIFLLIFSLFDSNFFHLFRSMFMYMRRSEIRAFVDFRLLSTYHRSYDVMSVDRLDRILFKTYTGVFTISIHSVLDTVFAINIDRAFSTRVRNSRSARPLRNIRCQRYISWTISFLLVGSPENPSTNTLFYYLFAKFFLYFRSA